ncbi:sensor histidine kinase [Terriglobus aquaticus]
MQNWTTEEGLPQNSVHALEQSQDGYLWLATEAGVARFNGLRFQRYTSANEPAFRSDDVCCIAAAEPGTLLFGTANGVVALRDGVFRPVRGVSGQVLSLKRESDGGVLVLTDSGLQRVSGETVVPVALPGGLVPSALGEATDGSARALSGTQLLKVRGTTVATLGVLPAGVQHLLADGNGDVWAATGSSLELRDGKLTLLRRWQVGRDLPGSRLESLQPWPGGVLVGTNRGAAVLCAREKEAAAILPLANDAVLSAVVDREGDAWFGTDSSGLFSVRDRSIGSVAGLAGESVTALAQGTDGRLWVGTRDAGLRSVQVEGTVARTVPARLASDVVLSVATAGDEVWVGSPEGLDQVRGTRVDHVTAADGLPDDFVKSLLVANDGVLWAGTRRGVALLRDGRVDRVMTAADGLPSDVIGAMLQDRQGTVWIGTLAGLVRWDGKALRAVPMSYGSSVAIAALHTSGDGTLWVGTGRGLSVLSEGRLLPVNLSAVRGSVAAVLDDSFGNLWIRSAAGLLRASAAALRGCAGKPVCAAPVRQFGVADGMPGVELPSLGTQIAMARRDGTLWFATRRGVAVVNPRESITAAVAPGIAIESVQVDGRAVSLAPTVKVGAGGRRVTITFAGLSLSAPGQVRYRYLLTRFDRDWSAWQPGGSAEYTNLPPGNFLFRVQAMSVEGVISERDATVTLHVQAPLYRQWWFYALLLLLAAGGAYGLYWLRLRRVRRDFATVLQERNRIAREIHDTLAQDFVAVSLQLEVTSELLRAGAVSAAKEQVDTTRTLVREGIQDARESIWAIRAEASEKTLPARLAAVVKRAESADLTVTGAYRQLPDSREREIFRIAKEALGNAQQHAHASHIQVDLVYSEDAILLRVSDDGAGFDVAAGAAKAGHYGVRGMRERAAAIGATLTVRSAPGEGTCVELRLNDR